MSFKVIKTNFLASLQDYGRFHHAQYGMSQCGVIDEHSFCWANYLLKNNFNDAAIEITFGNFHIRALVNTYIAVTGADMNFKINNKKASLYSCIKINKNDLLTWNYAKYGLHAYLSVKGGFKTVLLFTSMAVNLREKIGFKLQSGDYIACNENTNIKYRIMPQKYIPN